ncbi:MAG: transposase [Alphaproteobacteria bacterium]|nr:transposase [Alphaproteobacteria bacterium]
MKRTRPRTSRSSASRPSIVSDPKSSHLCRKHGLSKGTFHDWKAKFGNVAVSEAKRLNALGHKNVKMKKMFTRA